MIASFLYALFYFPPAFNLTLLLYMILSLSTISTLWIISPVFTSFVIENHLGYNRDNFILRLSAEK